MAKGWDDTMLRIHRVVVRKLKSVSELELSLETRPRGDLAPVTLVMGDNGAGKTTLLEAVTLLGHTPVFLGANPRTRESLMPPSEFDCTITLDLGLNDFRGQVCLYAAVETANKLTQSMTRPEDLGRWSVVADDEDFLDELIEYLEFSRPRATEGSSVPPASDRVEALRRGERVTQGFVAYINSDLYELEGPGLDVRETPKDLSRDLARIMIGRFQSYDLDSMRPLRIELLMRAFAEIFSHRELVDLRFVHAPNDPESDPTTGYRAVVQLRDRGTGDVYIGDFLSSGENEVLNILMVLLSLDTSNSILLLDEPELHLSAVNQKLFFEWLGRFAVERGNQIIMTTHSPFILSPLSREYLVYLRGVDGDVQVNTNRRWILGRMMSFFSEWFEHYRRQHLLGPDEGSE